VSLARTERAGDEYRAFLRSRWASRGKLTCVYGIGGALAFFAFDLAFTDAGLQRTLLVAAVRLPWIAIPVAGLFFLRAAAPGNRSVPAIVVCCSVVFTWGQDWAYHALGLGGTVAQALAVAACVVCAAAFFPVTWQGRAGVFALMMLGHVALDLAWPQPSPVSIRLLVDAALLVFVLVEGVVFENHARSLQRGLRLRRELEGSIAALVESRTRAAEAGAAVAHLAAAVAHDVNNPLAAVKVNVRWLAERARLHGSGSDDSAEADEVLEDALGAIERIARIVSDLGREAERHDVDLAEAELRGGGAGRA
jgi:signal transduction histidine kinase